MKKFFLLSTLFVVSLMTMSCENKNAKVEGEQNEYVYVDPFPSARILREEIKIKDSTLLEDFDSFVYLISYKQHLADSLIENTDQMLQLQDSLLFYQKSLQKNTETIAACHEDFIRYIDEALITIISSPDNEAKQRTKELEATVTNYLNH